MASNDIAGAQAIIKTAQLQREKALDLYDEPNNNNSTTQNNKFNNNPLLEQQQQSSSSRNISRRGGSDKMEGRRERQSSYGMDNVSRVQLMRGGGANPLFAGYLRIEYFLSNKY
jgi:hypothetical protein